MHNDCTIGDPNSLSDGRLKTEQTPVSGNQALSISSQIQAYTYDNEDLDQRRLGLIANEVASAIIPLAIDTVTSTMWHQDDQYKTLDYSRLVSLPIPAMNTLAKEPKILNLK